DATRFSLAGAAGDLQDIRFAVEFAGDEVERAERCEIARNFCNKLWNASRFVLMGIGEEAITRPTEEELRAAPLALADRWILSRLESTVAAGTQAIDGFSFDEACRGLNDFMWGDFCDWNVELAKPRLSGREQSAFDVRRLLVYVLERTLRLAPPFLPFIT